MMCSRHRCTGARATLGLASYNHGIETMCKRPEMLLPDAAGIARAVEVLRMGGIVALPTETVYGLAADARNDAAVAQVFKAKGRPDFNPLIGHVLDVEQARGIAALSADAVALAQVFWPGPLSMVLPLSATNGLSTQVTAGLNTVAIRVPAHPVMRAVLETFGGPIAAPSANPSGHISPTEAAHVVAGLGAHVAAVLDDGPCPVGVESTILSPGPPPVLLREGGVPREQIEPITGPLTVDTTPGRIRAPGQLSRHYAPSVPLHLGGMPPPGAVTIGFGPGGTTDFTLSPTGNLAEAAARLFKTLHDADAYARMTGAPMIHIAPVPDTGLGRAINDRLCRAAVPID